ncbi:MAG: hypothetical protein IJ733_21375, partial [Lachnospiraceae bacterium]|nr:hypothetical protein [Lachnospiraceae bacterium]
FIGLGKGAFSVGKRLFGSTNGGASLIGSLMGSAATGSGILGKSALLAIDLGAGNLAGGGSLSAGALSGLGMGVAAGGVAAGATVVSGTMDTYKAIKSTDKDESAAYGESAAWKFGGVAAGAAAGAALGSVIPGLGTAVGALIGAGVGGIAGWIKGDSIKEEYQDNVEEMQKEAEKAKKVFEATGLAIDDVRFRNEALTKAMNDSEVSAEEFAKMFQEECANVMENAFGDIHLSLNEVKKLASEIAFADKASEMEDFANAASNTQNSLNSLHNSVSALQKENWKVGLGLELSEIDKENYKTTIDNFVDSASSYIEDNHYEATVALKLLTNGKGSTKGLDTMYEGFESQIKKLGSKLGKEVENALKDGAIDMDEMSVIEKYQQKISDITDKLSKARSDAELQKIGIKYSGAELDAESYQAMQEELKVYADEAQTNYDDALTVTLTNLNLELSEGAITQEQYDKAVKKATKGYYAQLDDVSLRINNFNLDAITTAYADELNGILPYFEGTIQEKLQQALNNAMIKHPDVESWNTADAIGWFGLDKLPTDVATPIATQLIQSAQANTDTTKEQLIENYKKCIPTADEIYKAVDWNSFTFNDQDSLFEMIDPTWGTGTYYDLPQSEKSKTFSEYYGDNWEQSAKSTAEGIHRTMEENLDPEALNKVIEEYFTNIEIPSDNAQLIADSQEKGTAIGDSFNTGVTDSISNGSELYRSSAQTAIDSAFANPFSVNAKINITPSYSGLTLPTISTPNWGLNSGATGHNATGGYVSGKQLSWVGEDGPEAIIPLTPSRRNRALELYEQVGRNLGVGGYADGGIIGVSNTYGNFDTSDNATEGETSQTAIDSGNPQQSNSSIQVSVSMAPEFKISGGEGQSEEDIVAVVKKHIKEMADELGGEIAERLEQVFSNMPIKEA